jgi:hypothetical protein
LQLELRDKVPPSLTDTEDAVHGPLVQPTFLVVPTVL